MKDDTLPGIGGSTFTITLDIEDFIGTMSEEKKKEIADWWEDHWKKEAIPINREDLESLGFIFVGEDEDELEFRGSNNEELYFNPDNLKIIIYETPNMYCVFRGKIKNKSELKRLLTQLEL